MATFSSETRFRSVMLTFVDGFVCSVDGVVDDDEATTFSMGMRRNGTALHSTDDSNLAALQTIYATSTGFRNASGVGITPTTNLDGLEVEHVEREGYTNPLIGGSHARVNNAKDINLDQGAESTRAETDTGLVNHTAKVGLMAAGRTPDTATQNHFVDDWEVGSGGTGAFWLILRFDRSLGYTTAAEADSLLGATILQKFLADNKTAGDDVGTGWDGYKGNRRYTINTNLVFALTTVSYGGADGILETISLYCTIDSGTYERTALQTWLRSQIVTIDRVVDGEYPAFGSAGPVSAGSLVLPGGNRIIARNNTLWHSRPERDLPLDGVHGISVAIGADATAPTPPQASAVHLTAGVTITFQRPQVTTPPEVYGRQTYHNRTANADVTFKDWNDNTFLILKGGQRATFEFVHAADGTGELILADVPARRHNLSSSSVGALGSGNYFNFDATNWVRMLPAPALTGAGQYTDSDAFREGTDAVTDGSSFSARAHSDWAIADALEILMDGQIFFRQELELEITASGEVPAGHRTRLYLSRGGTPNTNTVVGPTHTYGVLGGVGHTNLYTVEYRGPVQKGDILIPVMIHAKGTSMNPGSINVTNFVRTVELAPAIEIDAAAGSS